MGWTCRALFLALALAGCVRAHDVDAEGRQPAPRPSTDFFTAECAAQVEAELDGLPKDLSCTGLYSDIEKKKIAEGLHEFAPAVPLWSDGSLKKRWIFMPAGEQIDNSDENEWVFPVGTKVFKEFVIGGKRIETRLLLKTRETRWEQTTYEWNEDETEAERVPGAGRERSDVKVGDGKTYRIPGGLECKQCHDGRDDFLLGFELISLAQKGATGFNLEKLLAEDLLMEPPPDVIKIGDDGTGRAAEALSWLHINCGVSCHNSNENAEAYSTDLRLKLNPAELDGRPSSEFSILTSTINVPAETSRWNNQLRIVPGKPEESLLYQLISRRVSGKNNQMPPIATRVVPEAEVEMIADWIRKMDPERQPGSEVGPD